MSESLSRREILLRHNAGLWEGTFIRLDGRGDECERFGSRLEVADRAGTIHADLTNLSTGTVRSMHFAEPPAEMQISSKGHWSLGPDRIGSWPWVCELCLVWGDRRRRVVVRHNTQGLESLVLVCEGRPGLADESPVSPLHLVPVSAADRQWQWNLASPVDVQVTTMCSRQPDQPETVCLQWQPIAGVILSIQRQYDSFGLLTA